MRTSGLRNRLLILLLTPLVLSGCASGLIGLQQTQNLTGDFCRIYKPIHYDASLDTVDTIKQIESLNSQFVCVCEHDCPN